jgi:hypothetical protein
VDGQGRRRWAENFIAAGLGMAAIVLLLEVTGYRILGVWPLGGAAVRLLGTGSWGRGVFAGRPFTLTLELLLAVGISIHAASTLICCVLKNRVRPLSRDGCVVAAVAAMILVWMGYFLNRPQNYYCWTILFCYTFLLPQLGRTIVSGRRTPRVVRWSAAAFTAAVLLRARRGSTAILGTAK